jgi:hypothetical protein
MVGFGNFSRKSPGVITTENFMIDEYIRVTVEYQAIHYKLTFRVRIL